MNLKTALLGAQKTLQDQGITSASLDAEVLLLATINQAGAETKDKSWLYLQLERYVLSPKEEKFYRDFIKRRARQEPVAYLLGHQEFYGLDFSVDRNVLIPRVETEIIVEEALDLLNRSAQDYVLMDVGTGSGCIPISILSTLRAAGKSSRIRQAYADDISPEALQVARKNARQHRLASRITFLEGDLEGVLKKLRRRTHVILTANLPYISPEDYEQLRPNVKDFEPALALTTEDRGLFHINRLIKKFAQLSPAFRSFALILEADPKQMAAIERLSRRELPGGAIDIRRDLRGKKRIIKIHSA